MKKNRAATKQNQQNECAPSEDSDQPGHPPSLIRIFPQDQDSLLVKRRNDSHSPGPVIRELVLALTREVNLAIQSSASSADDIRELGRAFQSLIVWGKKLPL